MSNNAIKILLVEDSDDYARLLQFILTKENTNLFELTIASQLSEALSALANHSYDVVLLDLSLPDSQGFDSFSTIHCQAPDMPIVVLTALADEALGIRAVREGAQDYLIKGGIEGPALVRSMRFAIERQQVVTKLQHLSLLDELTGLLNRRGFFSIARQQLKIARRTNCKLLLFFVDMDELKKTNDRFGHQQGDQALRSIASILRETFRSSDVIGRLGGDEFTILAIDARGDARVMLDRLQETIDQHNAASPLTLPLSLSVGFAEFDPGRNQSLEELMDEADRALYLQKQSKHRS